MLISFRFLSNLRICMNGKLLNCFSGWNFIILSDDKTSSRYWTPLTITLSPRILECQRRRLHFHKWLNLFNLPFYSHHNIIYPLLPYSQSIQLLFHRWCGGDELWGKGAEFVVYTHTQICVNIFLPWKVYMQMKCVFNSIGVGVWVVSTFRNIITFIGNVYVSVFLIIMYPDVYEKN